MSTVAHEKRLHGFLRRLKSAHALAEMPVAPVPRPEQVGALEYELVFSYLLWEASARRAATATARLHALVVDYNELRVCLVEEIVGMVGERYPFAQERAARLRTCLNEIYRREHSVTLDRLRTLPKRDAHVYLDTLEGMTPFVAARTMLLLDAHAFPVDARMVTRMVEQKVLPPESTPQTAATWLERHVRSGQIGGPGGAYSLIEAWLDAGDEESRAGRKRRRATPDAEDSPRSKVKATEATGGSRRKRKH